MSTRGSCRETRVGMGREAEARGEKRDREEAKASVIGARIQRMKEKGGSLLPQREAEREGDRQTQTDKEKETEVS